jgi:hypothetical protein
MCDSNPRLSANTQPASHRRVTGSLTPWVRDDLPSATVVVCARRDVPPSPARPPRAEARTASHNPRLAQSPKGFRERMIEHAVGRSGVPDHAILVPHCSTSLGYRSRDRARRMARARPPAAALSSHQRGCAQGSRLVDDVRPASPLPGTNERGGCSTSHVRERVSRNCISDGFR